MSETVAIPPSNLVVDAENPRLREPNQGQREVLQSIAVAQKQKIVTLARDRDFFTIFCGNYPLGFKKIQYLRLNW